MIKVSLSHNFGLKVVSLIAGVVVFLFVNSLDVPKDTNTRQVPLVVTGLPPDLEVVSKPDTINVTIRAPFEVMERLNLNNLKLRAYVDLESAEPGDKEYNVGLIRPTEIKDLDWQWDRTAPVVIERIIEQPRAVSVIWPDGYDTNGAKAHAEMVTIRGPSSEIQKIAGIRVILKPNDVIAGGSFTLPVEIVDATGKVLPRVEARPHNITVTVSAGQGLPKRDILISPNFTGQPKFGYTVQSITIEPASVVVQGDRKDIIDISTISTDPIRLDGLSKTTEIRTKLVLPDGIRLSVENNVMVRIRIGRS
ncbi:MAG: hypothetical protein KF784_03110 [Fimbriimonadaceae bacterium]|nr:hypothetical protein [Fimbriimonadaceae bacterium]